MVQSERHQEAEDQLLMQPVLERIHEILSTGTIYVPKTLVDELGIREIPRA